MKKLLLSLVGAAVAIPCLAFAQVPPHEGDLAKSGKDFSEVKQVLLSHIDEHRSCVAKAVSFEMLKGCRPPLPHEGPRDRHSGRSSEPEHRAPRGEAPPAPR
jgi:hypothetical protein